MNNRSYFRNRTFAYTLRSVGAIMAAIGVPGVVFLAVRHAAGSGYNITDVAVHLGRLYPAALAVFGLLALVGLGLFYLGLRRLAYPGSLVWRLTRLRR
ncbi:MAG TPA: hypothetical protein VGR91_07575 [Stellaceae bacterium]|nr:hypothetical protein [Stellaceae bacterium]